MKNTKNTALKKGKLSTFYNLTKTNMDIKKWISGLTAFTLALGVSLNIQVQETKAFTGSGSGTSGDPYIITTCSELQEMENDLAAYYELGNDIDCSATSSWNSGAGFDPVGNYGSPFTGDFNGNGKVISDLYINRTSTTDVGLFGGSTGAIYQIGLENIDITGYKNVGGLVGTNSSGGTILNSYTKGSVNNNNEATVGGLVGFNNYGTITNSYSNASVVGSYNDVGGLVGYTRNGADIINSYATGNVTGSGTKAGPLVGVNQANSIVNSYYYSGATCTGCDNTHGTAEATLSNFYDKTHDVYDTNSPVWDFSTIWQENASDFPNLKEPLFTEYQDISISSPYDYEVFQIDTDYYLTIANRSSSYPIYKWNGFSFVSFQTLSDSSNPADFEYFTIGTDHYLALAGANGSNSYIYKWNGSGFIVDQTLSAGNCHHDFEYFTIGTDHYLALAGYNGSVNSYIYKWNGSSFTVNQTFSSTDYYDGQYIQIGTDHYLAITNFSGSQVIIYKWNGSSFVSDNTISSQYTQDIEFFQIDTDYYLAAKNASGNGEIYQWNGSNFISYQSVSSSGLDWDYVQIGADHYLVSTGSSADIYKWDGSNFNIEQSIGINNVCNAHFFQINTDYYLIVGNYSGSISHVYKYTGTITPTYDSIPVTGDTQDWSGEADTDILLPGGSGEVTLESGAETLTFSPTQTMNLGLGTVSGGESETHNGTTVATALTTLKGSSVSAAKKTLLQSGTNGQPITLQTTGTTAASVLIPDDTTVYSEDTWDGIFSPPIDTSASIVIPQKNVYSGVKVGSDSYSFVMDKAARVSLSSITGDPMYKDGTGTWNLISACTDATVSSAGSLAFPNECYIEDSGTTYIWTYHFTEFGDAGDPTDTAVSLEVTPGSVTISAPTTIDFGSLPTSTSSTVQSVDLESGSDYFSIEDLASEDTGYYITLSAGDLTDGGNTIPSTNFTINLEGRSVTTFSTDPSGAPSIPSALFDPLSGDNPINGVTILERTSSVNGVIGEYGIQPLFKLTVPAYTALGSYTGTFTMTLM